MSQAYLSRTFIKAEKIIALLKWNFLLHYGILYYRRRLFFFAPRRKSGNLVERSGSKIDTLRLQRRKNIQNIIPEVKFHAESNPLARKIHKICQK